MGGKHTPEQRARENEQRKAKRLAAKAATTGTVQVLGRDVEIPKHDIAAQVKKLGADSLMSDTDKAKADKPKRRPKGKAAEKIVKRTIAEHKEKTRAVGKSPALAAPYGEKKGRIVPPPKAEPAKTTPTTRAKKPALVPYAGSERTNSRIPNATLALAYVRNGEAGKGMQRGQHMQCTCMFTAAQYAKLKDKADFNRVSIAEMIRMCVERA